MRCGGVGVVGFCAAVVVGCGSDGGTNVTLSLRNGPAALGPGAAPALLFSADGYTAAWDRMDSGGTLEVVYRRFAPGGAAAASDVIVGAGAKPRLAALGSAVGVSYVARAGNGNDELFFAFAEAGAAFGKVQITTLGPSGDFPDHDLAAFESTFVSVVCQRHPDATGRLVFTAIQAGAAMPAVDLGATKCKDVTLYPDGTTLWIGTTEEASGETAFIRRVTVAGVAIGEPMRLGATDQVTSAPRALSVVDAMAVVFHDGDRERPALQRFTRAGVASGSPATMELGGAVSLFGAAALQPGVLVVAPRAGVLSARAFNGLGSVDSDPLELGPGSNLAAPAISRSSQDALGVLWIDAMTPGQVRFVEVVATRN